MDENNNDFTDLASAIQTIKGLEDGSIDPNTIDLPDDGVETTEPIDNSTETVDEPVDKLETEKTETVDEKEDHTEEKTDDTKEEETEDKKVQTPEENRKFAEQRRQQEVEKRVQEELAKRMESSPEMQMVNLLSKQFGLTPEQMMQQIQLGQLQEQYPDVPVDLLQNQLNQQQQQQQEVAKNSVIQEQLANLQYQLWERDIKEQGRTVQNEFPVLTDDDLEATKDYMLNTLGTNVPFKQAALALYGDKIMDSLKTQARNEVLAEKSGRKTPLQPQGGKSPSVPTLTEDERQVAHLMGISEEDYLKYK